MVTIAFILLCHKDRDAITPQVEHLTSVGDKVATHFYLLSGDCMRIKNADYIHDYLDARDVDGIEIFDVFEGGWVKTGFCDERLVYRHLFNERSQPKGCYASRKVQQTLSLKRSIPSQLPVRIGSLWWCFRRQCVEAILEFIDQGKDIEWFFGATWLPDETFFQALARHFIPEVESDCRTPTIACKAHTRRVGLASERTTSTNFEALLPTLRNELAREIEAIRDQQFPKFYRIRKRVAPENSADPLAKLLGIEQEKALEIARNNYLFLTEESHDLRL